MKSKLLFEDLNKRTNVIILPKNEELVEEFKNKYSKFWDRMLFSVMENCGGIIIDNWFRLYGCGKLNVLEKNKKYNVKKEMDIIIGEDVIGGLFGLKDRIIYYFSPKTLEWEDLNIFYTEFINWLINFSQDVNLFYESFRWKNWEYDVKNLDLDYGVSFYPFLFMNYEINNRSRKIIPMDEIIGVNMDIKVQLLKVNEKNQSVSPNLEVIDNNSNNISEEVIKIFNENSFLPVRLLSSDIDELKTKQIFGLRSLSNYMSYDYFCTDFEIKYSGYPTDEDGYKMNYIKLYTNKYHFIGIRVGITTIDEANIILKKYGFINENNQNASSNTNYMYKNQNCIVEFSVNLNIINWIKIELKSEYLGNNMY